MFVTTCAARTICAYIFKTEVNYDFVIQEGPVTCARATRPELHAVSMLTHGPLSPNMYDKRPACLQQISQFPDLSTSSCSAHRLHYDDRDHALVTDHCDSSKGYLINNAMQTSELKRST